MKFDFITNVIAIEGSDGSGKMTQSKLLYNYLKDETNASALYLDYPVYGSSACKPIEALLAGEYETEQAKVNPYFAGAMYSIDRHADLLRISKSGEHYDFAIANRYTASNFIHQGCKFKTKEELMEYFTFMNAFEHGKLEVPYPAATIYLYVPYEICYQNAMARKKFSGSEKVDINETVAHLKMVDEHVHRLRAMTDWYFIDCVDEHGIFRTVESIHAQIKEILYNAPIEHRNVFFPYKA